MSNDSASTAGGGIGFIGLLTLLFIALKLTKVIAWSWFWVLSPTIFGSIIVGLILVGIIIWEVVS